MKERRKERGMEGRKERKKEEIKIQERTAESFKVTGRNLKLQ